MRLFIWQALASQGLVTPWYGPYWSCYRYRPLETKACLIGRKGLVQTSRGFWKFTRGQPSVVTTSETRGRGKFRFGHFEASNPDETQGSGLLGRRGGGGTQESSGWVLGEISPTFSMHLPLGRTQASRSQGPSSLQGNRQTSGLSESKTKYAFSTCPGQRGKQVEGNWLPVLKYLTPSESPLYFWWFDIILEKDY